eukprot:gb/GFBE01080380.1/.p1 GENE.gb/GFBE01080380.1/~~gb/GFBE01080380.1/.p1  ORF type:complete len:412 (+),score=63.28 gb/GFBE01080380.1/:1-1236(+)
MQFGSKPPPFRRTWILPCLAGVALLAETASRVGCRQPGRAYCLNHARPRQADRLSGRPCRHGLVPRRAVESDLTATVMERAEETDLADVDRQEENATQPWQPWSTWPVGAVASLGALDCAYLTYAKLTQSPLACPVSGGACNKVLESSWSMIGPVPLAAVGFLAYCTIILLSFNKDVSRELLWWLCFGMAIASLGLMALLAFVLKAPCPYCAASAFISAALLTTVEVSEAKSRRSMPRAAFLGTAAVVALAALRGALPVAADEGEDSYAALTERYKPEHPPVRSSSSEAEIALAKHLTKIGAACYTAWWCPHCQDQRESFGKEATAVAPFVECSSVQRRQLDICKDAKIEGYPSWIIDGKVYRGGRELSELAAISGFTEYPATVFQPRDEKASDYIWGRSETESEGPEIIS